MLDFTPNVKAFEAYLKSLNKSFHTVKQYTIDSNQFSIITRNSEDINEALQRYTIEIQTLYPSKNSVNRKFAAIRQFLLFLHSRGVIPLYNEQYLQKLTKEQTPLVVLPIKQLQQALSFWPHQYDIALTEEHAWLALRNTAIVYIIAELALKPAELVRMQWRHIDDTTNELTVIASKSFRILPITKELSALLLRYQQHTTTFMPLTEYSPYVWLGVGNKLGEPISVKTIERIYKAMSEQLGFKVTATNMRYHAIQKELKNSEDLDLYKQFGYARKWVLDERGQRFNQKEK
ncbi:tyrosine-type recombinase/integrase [Solibacillus daqui]|uniref:tyrosine-type recombinase/integrase n=1 Tax=Solibacillus daqui TaxID=2912187 RepID=UPI00236733D1|nr:recombinase XerD [Solibacillus daqui]